MKRTIAQSVLYVVLVGISLFTGCSADEAAMQEIARKEAMKALIQQKKKSLMQQERLQPALNSEALA